MTECENSATLVTLASKVPNATPLCSAEALDPGSSRICATVHEDHVTWTLSLCQRVTKFCRQKEKKNGVACYHRDRHVLPPCGAETYVISRPI